MEPSKKETVLVTGATGFIAMHTIIKLLAAGFKVRGTIRSKEKAPALLDTLLSQPETLQTDPDQISLHEAELGSDAGWNELARGCDYILHLASPVPAVPPKDEEEVIRPAREGTLRVLQAAVAAGVKRVVMTSSIAAVLYGHKRDGARADDESDWTRLEKGKVGAYEKSKTLAEKAAWDFIDKLGPERAIELVTINPGLVLGPILGSDYSTSGELIRKLMKREVPGCANLGWATVDVRDVAEAHINAMQNPEAAGQRFILALPHAGMQEVAKILLENFGKRGYKPPQRRIPDFALKAFAKVDRTAALALYDLGLRQDLSTTKAEKTLNWKPRSLEETVVSMGESMIEHGVV